MECRGEISIAVVTRAFSLTADKLFPPFIVLLPLPGEPMREGRYQRARSRRVSGNAAAIDRVSRSRLFSISDIPTKRLLSLSLSLSLSLFFISFFSLYLTRTRVSDPKIFVQRRANDPRTEFQIIRKLHSTHCNRVSKS